MAKEQNLSLNPTKISGVCGRLMCCLKNEEETYEELNRKLPGIGDFVTTDDGLKGEVQSVNVLRQMVKVIVDVGDEKEIQEYPADQLHFKKRHGKKNKAENEDAELKELENLEKQDGEGEKEQHSEKKKEHSEHSEGKNRGRFEGKGRSRNRSERKREN